MDQCGFGHIAALGPEARRAPEQVLLHLPPVFSGASPRNLHGGSPHRLPKPNDRFALRGETMGDHLMGWEVWDKFAGFSAGGGWDRCNVEFKCIKSENGRRDRYRKEGVKEHLEHRHLPPLWSCR